MRTTVERLRLWILAVAVLAVGSILLFFAYARWQARRITRDLPAKLGISIQQSTEGFTFSKSEGGHTLFTLHAAKTVQYKGGGHANLHNVSITLYDANGAPADRIHGNDFDYDPASGMVRANGAVQIDLQGPASAAPAGANTPPMAPPEETENESKDNKGVVHVKTADLVFNQKTGLASTSKPIEFRIAEASGNATGASIDSRKGVLVLDHDVSFDSSLEGDPLKVRARYARFDRDSRQLYLLQTITSYQSSRSSSDQATVYFRSNGTASLVKAQGHVAITNENQKIASGNGFADLDAKSRPQQVVLRGGVSYAAKDAARTLRGTAAEGTLLFGPQTSIQHAQLRNAVSIVDQENVAAPPAGKRPKSYQPVRAIDRDVKAGQVDIDFARGPNRKPEAQRILATGEAKLNIRTLYANTPPQQTSIEGDRLLVTLRNGTALSDLRGAGHTKLALISPDGVKQTSTGNSLRMTFASPGGGGAAAAATKAQFSASRQESRIESAEQQGNVTLVQVTPARQAPALKQSSSLSVQPAQQGAAGPAVSTATAERATYESATQSIRLSGNPRLRDASGELTASTIDFERLTGDATAAGSVKATYRQSGSPSPVSFGGAEPIHVVASHARLDRAKGLSTFYGSAGEKARLWQGVDSIAAPIIEISRPQQTLAAHGAYGARGPGVQTNGSENVEAALTRAETSVGKKVPARQGQKSEVRINSRTLLYSDAEAKAVFHGDVVARSSSGSMAANQMDVYFTASNGAGGPAAANRAAPAPKPEAGHAQGESAKNPEKEVERIVARGEVRLEEPGRKATGDKLVFTAQDGNFVLTGSRHAPPQLADQVHGTVTGASLIFNDHDDSVMVSGGSSQAVTETRVAK